jgi:aspartyl-tRNA(Asn)/glutamyl-tRNA(Gln) amidotransferase subunit C
LSITRKEVEHVALLARLELSEKEKEDYTNQLNSIIGYMNKINELNTENVEPTAHVLPIFNVMREDTAKDSLDREEVLKNAPDKENGQFKVPRIV